ncbi:CPXV210 protein [Cowpox virus]|uniref:CPXV210 protein n=1 Tax=Cowpox virus TaxID=10243 RepID=A0A212Q4Q8_COWPX|nr:CPXV210 protein [Cowpox virus]
MSRKFMQVYEYDREQYLDEFIEDRYNDSFITSPEYYSAEKYMCRYTTLNHNCVNVRRCALDSKLLHDIITNCKIYNNIELVRATKFVYYLDLIKCNWVSKVGDSVLYPVIFITHTSTRNLDKVSVKTYKGVKVKKLNRCADHAIVINPFVKFKLTLPNKTSHAKVLVTFCKLRTDIPPIEAPLPGNVLVYTFPDINKRIPGYMHVNIEGCIDGTIYINSSKFMCILKLHRSMYRIPPFPIDICSCCSQYTNDDIEIPIHDLIKDVTIFKNKETVYYLKLNNKTIARFTYFNNIDTAITREHEYVKIALGIVCKLMINNMHSIVGVNHSNTFVNCLLEDNV